MVAQDAESDPKYRCAECNLQFGTPRDLSRHLHKTARHGGQPSPCAICHKPLTRPDSRARHERRCRERFGVTEEMWQGIERERQRGRRKSISIDGADEAINPAGDGGGTGCDATDANSRECCGVAASTSSRSRTVSVSEVSDAAELTAAFASAQVGSALPASTATSRFVSQPGEPGPWARKRSTSLRLPQPPHAPSTNDALINGRNRRESSPHSRGVLPLPPQSQARGAPVTASWRPPNRLSHHIRGDSPPFDPPSSPMAMHDESDGESMASSRAYQPQPRWTPLVKREERLVELAQEGEDEEVDELEDEPWLPPVSPRTHNHYPRAPERMMGPPPKKKLFGFELDGTGAGVAGWPSHKTQR
ncbi:hypothetical protein F5148DRAFT_106456 [Russula earlei]|uniref:Uncharacterized protein n=1 Tax=Russula earlei TaxID=71964 RepID=A0ACC0TT37_9AGAM|nr:hypothetical protein F5148DRAFT_106456 [Russula earlei]